MSGAATTDSSRALPLLSGPAPRTERAASTPNCHRCSKEFGLLTRRKFCNHCGFSYCGSCCDHQALSPRPASTTTRPGYETVIVCTYCIEMLSITASGKSQLRSMAVAKLRSYLDAYGIQPKSMLEKGDLVEAILDARGLNGCLSPEQERYYRTQTIPRRPTNDHNHRNNARGNMFSSQSNRSGPAPPPRPRSTDPRVDARAQSQRPSAPPPPNFRGSDPYQNPSPQYPRPMSPRQGGREERPPPINTTWSPQGSNNAYGTMPRQRSGESSPPPLPRWQTRPQSPPPPPPPDYLRPPSSAGRSRSRSASVPSSDVPPPIPNQPRPPQSPNYTQAPYAQAPHHQQPPPPPPLSPRPRASPSSSNSNTNATPPLSNLLEKSRTDISSLNIATLKAILQANHVNARLILEKSELVDKVMRLIEIEKQERAREQAIHEAEERAAIEAQRKRMEEMEIAKRQQQQGQTPQQQTAQTNPEARRDSGSHEDHMGQGTSASVPPMNGVFVDRQGLCVVCQDEEANVAIVDCGHLALCMACSDIIMKSTRECPLCRTRIVTEQRLLRIFKS